MVSRFIREGRLHGVRANKKDGWMIKEYDLYDFIDEEMPGIVEMVYVYDKYSESIIVQNSEGYLKVKKRLSSIDVDQDAALNKIHSELNFIKEQIKRLKKPSIMEKSNSNPKPNPPKVNPSKNTEEKKNKYAKLKYENFKKVLKGSKVFTEQELVSNDLEIKAIYRAYYDETNKIMRSKIIQENNFKCPITGEKMKTFVPLLKNTVPQIMQKIETKELFINEDGTIGTSSGPNEKKENVKNSPEPKNSENIKGEDVDLEEEEVDVTN
jgi:hypothetical protein